MPIPNGPHLEFEQPIVELSITIEDLLRTGEIIQSDVKDLTRMKDATHTTIASKLTDWNRV